MKEKVSATVTLITINSTSRILYTGRGIGAFDPGVFNNDRAYVPGMCRGSRGKASKNFASKVQKYFGLMYTHAMTIYHSEYIQGSLHFFFMQ